MQVVTEAPPFDQRAGAASETAKAQNGREAVLPLAWAFVRAKAWAIGAISLAVLVPCFWHRHLAACDLGSHVYNAWLATLIERGQAPGLYLVHRWDNVLFDMMLTRLGGLVGWGAGERIAVSLSVLIFFWGAFALMSAASRRAGWYLLPGIGMIAYGWTFEVGFSNYYLSLGLGFWSAALLWRGKGWELLLGVALLPFVWSANPLGVAMVAGTVAFARIFEALPKWWKILPLAAAAAVVILARMYFVHHYSVQWMAKPLPLYLMNGVNGVDQLVLGSEYKILARAVFILGAGCLALDCVERLIKGRPFTALWVPVQLYAILLLATAVMPDRIRFPQYPVPLGFLLTRLSLVSAVMAVCVLACMAPKKWHLAAFGALALIFFILLYRDTRTLDRMQQQADALVSQLPPGQRVSATIWPLRQSRFYFIDHMVDRACVERCFSYSNFEPSSEAFRIRVRPGSPVAAATPAVVDAMETGAYVVQVTDLPMFQVYQCDAGMTNLCMRELHAGEQTGRVGFNPGP